MWKLLELLTGQNALTEGLTAAELKEQIDSWMHKKFQVTVSFDPREPIKQLENFGILQTKQKGTVSGDYHIPAKMAPCVRGWCVFFF